LFNQEGDSARMLNQTDERGVGASESDWCVGEPPVRWDVSFGARLAEKIRQIFWRDGDRAAPDKKVETVLRKAA
jgi:hypothetical protein